jgi:hypothetical protein
MKQKIICIISLVALISGCGGGSGSSNDNELTEPSSNDNELTELEGTWLKTCSAVDLNDSETLYDIIELKFVNNEINSSILNFTDPQCSTSLSISPNPTSSGEFSLGGQVTTSGGLQSTKIDTSIDTFNGAPFLIDEFGIYFIDNNTVYFGDKNGVNDGSTPDLRPISLDYNRIFIRQ